MFLGEFLHKVDSKNRIMIPSEFRDDLGEFFYISKGPESSLILYTQEEFEKKAVYLDQQIYENENKKNRAIKRLFFSSTVKVSLDKVGRILINKNLKDYSQIDKEAVIIGNNSTVEIFSVEKWNEYIDEVEVKLSDLMD